jgi:uncharacterized protein
LARIEVDTQEQHLFFDTDVLDKVTQSLKQLGFLYVTLDLEGYQTGSMLKEINQV